MQKMFLVWLCLCLYLAGAGTVAATPFSWPHGAKAAVSLAYDDTLASQLDIAIPALNAQGLKASFYLQLSSPLLTARLSEWRTAAVQGHELGNHTLFHQCPASKPGRSWVATENDLDNISAVQLVQQIRLANAMLFAIDGKTERTFTAPCGDGLAGGQPYLPLIYGDFVAIKAKTGAIVADMAQLNVYAVEVIAPVGSSGAELITLVKQATQHGTMVNFTFHGVGRSLKCVGRSPRPIAGLPGCQPRYLLDRYFYQYYAPCKSQQAVGKVNIK